jgi:hypothetical protein
VPLVDRGRPPQFAAYDSESRQAGTTLAFPDARQREPHLERRLCDVGCGRLGALGVNWGWWAVEREAPSSAPPEGCADRHGRHAGRKWQDDGVPAARRSVAPPTGPNPTGEESPGACWWIELGKGAQRERDPAREIELEAARLAGREVILDDGARAALQLTVDVRLQEIEDG